MDSKQGCCKGSCGCNAGMDRRTFLKLSAAAGAAAMLGSRSAIAGPFTRADFDKLVPADKKLSPDWIRSLYDRGSRTVYRGAELETIGMPIGGLCAGQLYLGGDGMLWHWDIFNHHVGTGAEHYAKPMKPVSPIGQGFAISIGQGDKRQTRTLDANGFSEVSFIGEYPVGFVEYRDPAMPLVVSLEAFSPFIPHNVQDSSLPATVMRFTVKNTGTEKVEGAIAGWLENGVCLYSGKESDGFRRNQIVQKDTFVMLDCSAEGPTEPKGTLPREDIVFDDFEKPAYEGWTAEGTAFGNGPIETKAIPGYQGDIGGHGDRVVNSHATAPGDTVEQKDSAVGTLTSRPFMIERDYIRFRIGGGSHAGKTCINLQIDSQTVRSATGANDNRMKPQGWSVRRWKGKTAQLVIVDAETGGWGNIGIDEIVFSDVPPADLGRLQDEPDYGTMGLALLDPQKTDATVCELPREKPLDAIFTANNSKELEPTVKPFTDKLSGSLARSFALAPGESTVATFIIAWLFPNLVVDRNNKLTGRSYAQSFASAMEVVGYLAANFKSLRDQTLLWHDTWYDSTLPYWFLDRTFLNTSILATSTCYRFADGRFYGWEGVGCCPGTCGHVWQYAHAVARLFPELERDTRQRVDLGLAMKPDGAIFFRGEFNDFPAIDAQAGVILRALREHQMTTGNDWLKSNWPKIRRATEWLIAKDANDDGIIESNQHNTLDTDWFGPVAWLSGLYLAALRAAEAMATIAGDSDFAVRCRSIVQRGQKNLVEQLFDGEYFINKPDPGKPETINSGTGCEIDQVMGQSWAFQVGLPRILPEKETRSALASLWKYNFTPDVGPYRKAYPPGRWYAMPGEGGLLMCSFPRSDWDYDKAKGKGADWAAGYFNECMNGFEYQAAGHMIWEGLVQEGLAVTRMLHDRYHASRRNPFNEVECGDHYARSMASYGVYLAACGYRYDGPAATLAFDPRLSPDNFRAAFTTAQGWGSVSQKRQGGKQSMAVNLRWGSLRLRYLSCGIADNAKVGRIVGRITSGIIAQSMEFTLKPSFKISGKEMAINLEKELVLHAGQTLDIEIA